MPRTTFVQNNFTSGEWSQRLLARNDLSKYRNAMRLCENYIVQQHGGIQRRSGTRYVVDAKHNNKATRLIPFEFSVTETYVLEFGDGYIRFYKDNGQILSGGSAYEISSPYSSTELAELKYTQSADVLYLCHPDYTVRQLNRASDTSWTLTEFANVDGPYLSENTTTTTLSPSGTTGVGITIVASAVTGINGGSGFLSTDVGRIVRIKHTSAWGYATITAVGSTTSVTATVVEDFGASTAESVWRLGAWSGTTGYPWSATFHHERLWFGGTDANPQTLYASVVGDFVNFQPTQSDGTVNDDDGVSYTISDDQVNPIRWLKSSDRGLLIGTGGGAFAASTSNLDPITPINLVIRRQTTRGSHSTVDPIQIDNTVLYLEKGGRKILEYTFSFEKDQFVAPDMTLLAEHVTVGGVTDMAFQQEPFNILWCVRADGQFLGLTYQRQEEVVAWHRHILGGTLNNSANPTVESIASVREGSADRLWMVANRTINGVDVKSIEYLEAEFNAGDQEDSFFLDMGATYDSVPETSITGLSHLEGQTVSVLADGGVLGDKVVSGGAITLSSPASVVHVGFSFNSNVKAMPFYPPGNIEPRGKYSRVVSADILLHETLGLQTGPDENNLDELTFRSPSDPMDSPVPLFTGIKEVFVEDSFDRQTEIYIRQSSPLPGTILGAYVELELGGV